METTLIHNKIFSIRGQKVMLDFDLAMLYEVETKRLNEQVKRNNTRFPEDFMFQLTRKEWLNLKSQNATSSWGGTRKLPYTFTEHGVTMLASVLKSDTAIAVNLAIVRAFIAMRTMALTFEELSEKIISMEDKYDMQFLEVYAALNKLITENNKQITWEERKRIGYETKKENQE